MVIALVLAWLLQEPTAAPRVELPKGPAAVALAATPDDVRSAKLAWSGLPLSGDAPEWRQATTWSAWAEALRAEAHARGADPQRVTRLALFARLTGRDDDAWDHFAALKGAPEQAAALLPLFLPGVQATELLALDEHSGACVGPLRDGVLLSPAAPPPSVAAADVRLGYASIERRAMSLDELRIGAAVVRLQVSLESDGVQIDLTHKSGGAATVRVLLPELPDFEIYVQYDDWVRQEAVGVPLQVALAPGDETHSLFGRFRPRRIAWPTELPTRASHALASDGLVLVLDEHSARAPVLRAATDGLARLIEAPCRVEPLASSTPGAVRIDLSEDADGRKWSSILSLAERWALAHPSAPKPGR
ncbi:MAG: hypothetical protein K8S98_07135 [Planctomycetes bacterium]|nr:hypothetical protein [Planctomycetota bacterium]